MTKLRWILGALGAAALAVPAMASAQDYDQPDTQVDVSDDGSTTVTTTQTNQEIEQKKGPSDRGVRVQAQGGVVTFPGEVASQLSPGALYGVTVGIRPPIPVVGLELAYQGAAYQTDERLTGAQENAVENGGQALLTAGPLVGKFEPYVFGGYQLSRFNVYERPNSNGAIQDDTINKAPVGAGVDVHLGEVLVGARGSYNFLFDTKAFNNISPNNKNAADQISGSLLVGGQF